MTAGSTPVVGSGPVVGILARTSTGAGTTMFVTPTQMVQVVGANQSANQSDAEQLTLALAAAIN